MFAPNPTLMPGTVFEPTASVLTGKKKFGTNNMGKKADSSQAEWERHTKGFGSKMLGKMGFKPGEGLGKNHHVRNP
jgi:hypothetical protein